MPPAVITNSPLQPILSTRPENESAYVALSVEKNSQDKELTLEKYGNIKGSKYFKFSVYKSDNYKWKIEFMHALTKISNNESILATNTRGQVLAKIIKRGNVAIVITAFGGGVTIFNSQGENVGYVDPISHKHSSNISPADLQTYLEMSYSFLNSEESDPQYLLQ